MKNVCICLLLILVSCNSSHQEKKAVTGTRIDGEYVIEDILIETEKDIFISGIVVKKKDDARPKPAILQHTIYVRNRDVNTLKHAVDNGYIGIITYSRGKYKSPNDIFPYENEATDTYAVIDWISKQKWCNGKVGMYGGSYNGFTQWAATKKMHPALKTIVPAAANRPGNGLPMENNIFINPNYEWAFYVGNNKTLDTVVGNDRQRFRSLQFEWWNTGSAYKKMDSIDGTPNAFFQRWISHPSYDEYWQNMVPYKEEFTNIDIPILTFDGYYNDSQNSNLYFYRQHYKYNKNAENYLIIGAYDHFGAQKGGRRQLRGYQLDENGLIDPLKITYEWFDYTLKDGEKPAILKDKINYQVMETNTWQSAPSIEKMHNQELKLFLADSKEETYLQLVESQQKELKSFSQTIDFKDRNTSNNNNSYPDPIIENSLNPTNGFTFITKPFEEDTYISGSFSGELIFSINKKDVDVGVTLFEVLPNGEFLHLSGFIGRASYAKDETTRNLLTPNELFSFPFSNTRLISKKLQKGSQLLMILDVNSNPFSQLNYGTGKDVSDENLKDASEALQIKWFTDSFIKIPIFKP
ncbi:CocE/NonD family hydrolase [Kordia sp.]|uniref:CocE/NonD family hydrolase n=1 Tax=Kordia sp. TaxID=1965332 RepID=UPI003D6C0DC3